MLQRCRLRRRQSVFQRQSTKATSNRRPSSNRGFFPFCKCSNFKCYYGLAPAGLLCRPAVDICDQVDYCDGQSQVCPFDAVKPSASKPEKKKGTRKVVLNKCSPAPPYQLCVAIVRVNATLLKRVMALENRVQWMTCVHALMCVALQVTCSAHFGTNISVCSSWRL